MKQLHTALLTVPLTAIASLVAVSSAAAQAQAAGADDWEVPRTVYGHPDLQGNWTNSTLTPLERPEGMGPVYTWEEVERIEQGTDECPPNPGTVECGRTDRQDDTSLSDAARLTGAEYDEVYWERGTKIAVVNGEPRTSLVTRPANGRIPPRTPEVERMLRERSEFRNQFGDFDHPELRPLAERCILFGSPAGPPMIPVGAYNSNYTIVQTADHVVIMSEMIHDARIIRIGEPRPLPDGIRPFFGNSSGRWEGDTLVVETTDLSPDQPIRGVALSEQATVTERFTRADEETILYEFTVDDPGTYTEPWGGEVPLAKLHAQLYEYACHEGNYSLTGILSGARYQESLEAEN